MITANPLFAKNEILFTSGESTNATHNATIIIPVNGTEQSKIFVATLRPVPPHVDTVRVINNQAIIIIIDSQSKYVVCIHVYVICILYDNATCLHSTLFFNCEVF